MNKLFIAFAFLFMAVISCKKTDTTPTIPTTPITPTASGNYITTSIDGSPFDFSKTLTTSRSFSGGYYHMEIVGFSNTPSSKRFALWISSSSPIVAGTYGIAQGAYITYTEDGTYYSISSTPNPVAITISSISTTSVQGTFKGNLYYISSRPIKVLADGKFSATF